MARRGAATRSERRRRRVSKRRLACAGMLHPLDRSRAIDRVKRDRERDHRRDVRTVYLSDYRGPVVNAGRVRFGRSPDNQFFLAEMHSGIEARRFFGTDQWEFYYPDDRTPEEQQIDLEEAVYRAEVRAQIKIANEIAEQRKDLNRQMYLASVKGK